MIGRLGRNIFRTLSIKPQLTLPLLKLNKRYNTYVVHNSNNNIYVVHNNTDDLMRNTCKQVNCKDYQELYSEFVNITEHTYHDKYVNLTQMFSKYRIDTNYVCEEMFKEFKIYNDTLTTPKEMITYFISDGAKTIIDKHHFDGDTYTGCFYKVMTNILNEKRKFTEIYTI